MRDCRDALVSYPPATPPCISATNKLINQLMDHMHALSCCSFILLLLREAVQGVNAVIVCCNEYLASSPYYYLGLVRYHYVFSLSGPCLRRSCLVNRFQKIPIGSRMFTICQGSLYQHPTNVDAVVGLAIMPIY